MVLTFDDSSRGQFNILPDETVDPDSAVGILLAFHQAHPADWPLRATFFVLQDVDAQIEPLANTATRTINDFGTLARDVDKEVEPLASEAKGTMREYRKLGRNVNAKVTPLSKSALEALDTARSALNSIDGLVGKKSPTRADLDSALQELAGAARSLRLLADYLEKHPDAIIKGKGY